MGDHDPLQRPPPRVSHPGLVKRRAVALERVTMRPATAPSPAQRRGAEATAKRGWRVAQGMAAAAIVASVPLAHAGAPDPDRHDAPAIEIAFAPEPFDAPPTPHLAPPLFAKLEGLKESPYDAPTGLKPDPYIAMRARERPATRPRIVQRAPRVVRDSGEPHKLSDLKSSPYD